MPANLRLTFARLKRTTERLHALIETGEFYSFTYQKRRKLLRQVRRLYGRLIGPVSATSVAASLAAASVLALAGCFGPTDPAPTPDPDPDPPPPEVPQLGPPAFAAYVTNPFGLGGTYNDYAGKGPLVFADLDATGDLDLIHSHTYSGDGYRAYIADRMNTGGATTPTFAALRTDTFLAPSFEFSRYRATEVMDAGDIDGDGNFDLLVSEYNGVGPYYARYLSAVLNTGTNASPTFGAATLLNTAYDLTAEAAAAKLIDLDGDGDLDVIGVDEYGYINWFPNRRDGAIEVNFGYAEGPPPVVPDYTTAFPMARTTSFDIADIDGDGDLDTVVAVYDSADSSHKILFFENQGSGVFGAPQANPFGITVPAVGWDISPPTTGHTFDIAVVDIDDDGDVDIFMGPYSYYVGGYAYEFETRFYFLENTQLP